MTTPPDPDDATLARAAASGDSTALGLVYDRYGGRLLGFCTSMLRSRADAEDCLQDVFVIAATKLRDLREPALLRSWLFAVARHECLARLDRRRREVPVEEFPDRAAPGADLPAEAALDAELAALLRDAEGGLSDRDRLLLELADRQGLDGEELARAVGVPRSTAYTLVARARATAVRSIGALLVARTGRSRCPQLDQLLSGWDGQLTALRRKQIARHIDDCETCETQRRRVATPAALLGEGQAFAAGYIGLRTKVLAASSRASAIANGRAYPGTSSSGVGAGTGSGTGSGVGTGAGSGSGSGEWIDGWPPADSEFAHLDQHHRSKPARLVLLALLLLILAGTAIGTLAYWAQHRQPAALVITGATTAAQRTPPPTVQATATPSPTTPTTAQSTAHTPPAVATTRAAPKNTPTATATATSTQSAHATPTATVWTLLIYTGHDSATVNYGGATADCLPGHINTPCSYTLPEGEQVAIVADNTFTAPASCTSTGEDCDITMTSNITVRLTGS